MRTAEPPNVVRQPTASPTTDATGTPTTVAMLTPNASADETTWFLPGTACVPAPKANDQYPASATPSRSRPTSSTAKLGAIATTRFDSAAAASSATSTVRRSARGSSTAMLGAVRAPAIAVAATARPAVPSLTPTSAASVGSTLAGRNSLRTTIPIPNESATTGVQVGVCGWSLDRSFDRLLGGEPAGALDGALSGALWVGMAPA